jgi:hypothetical protein
MLVTAAVASYVVVMAWHVNGQCNWLLSTAGMLMYDLARVPCQSASSVVDNCDVFTFIGKE